MRNILSIAAFLPFAVLLGQVAKAEDPEFGTEVANGSGVSDRVVVAGGQIYRLGNDRVVSRCTASGWINITAADIQTLVSANDRLYWLNQAGAVAEYDGTVRHITAADIQTLVSANDRLYWLNRAGAVAEYDGT